MSTIAFKLLSLVEGFLGSEYSGYNAFWLSPSGKTYSTATRGDKNRINNPGYFVVTHLSDFGYGNDFYIDLKNKFGDNKVEIYKKVVEDTINKGWILVFEYDMSRDNLNHVSWAVRAKNFNQKIALRLTKFFHDFASDKEKHGDVVITSSDGKKNTNVQSILNYELHDSVTESVMKKYMSRFRRI